MTVHDNSWDLNFDNFSEFQNVPPSLCVRKSICGSPLALYSFFRNLPCSTPNLLAVDADRIFVTLNIFCVSRTRCFFLLIHFLVVEDYELPIEIFSFLIKKDMVSDLNMFHGKNVWFCFISIAWVHFSHKTEKFWFWKSLKYFNSLW